MNITLSVAFLFLFCIDYYFMYKRTVSRNPSLSEKQRAYIMSIKAASTLFLLSLYYNYRYISADMTEHTYLQDFTDGDFFLLQIGTLHLVSYFIMDCSIGYFNYHKFLCGLSGYAHHIIYGVLGLIGAANIRWLGPYYILFLIEELPTIILSIGNYNRTLRRDKSFGFFFFMTRICYHTFLTWRFQSVLPILMLGLSALSVHGYWFRNWVTKYFFKTETKTPSQLKQKAKCTNGSKRGLKRNKYILRKLLKNRYKKNYKINNTI